MVRSYVSIAIAASAAGCSLFTNLDALRPDASAPGDAQAIDAGADVVPCSTGQGSGGPVMIQTSTYCIDSTEVTVAQYSQFLDAGPDVTLPADCSWKTTYVPNTDGGPGCTPTNNDPAAHPNHPISCVDWCDAFAFCAWAGKRLCGTVTGGSLPYYLGATVWSSDEWYLACATTTPTPYPTGATYTTGECNVQGSGTSLVDVGSLPCQGGYAGLFDMAGNVSEWVDSCSTGAGRGDNCNSEGDNWSGGTKNSSTARCDNYGTASRDYANATLGFRCCSKP
jgi:formylglycine-generating enzyme required for sulfatase activity